jgi:hypothetical protein
MLSWERRRALYLDRLRSETGFLVLATEAETVVGYALVCIERGPDDTFAVGDRYAELFSLSVVPHGVHGALERSFSTSSSASSRAGPSTRLRLPRWLATGGSSACTSGAGIGQRRLCSTSSARVAKLVDYGSAHERFGRGWKTARRIESYLGVRPRIRTVKGPIPNIQD